MSTLCNRRYTEKSIAYVESHDQGLVGDQTVGARGRVRLWRHSQKLYSAELSRSRAGDAFTAAVHTRPR